MLLPVVATLLPLIKHDHWVFRIFDFPRLQIAIVSLICLPINAIFASTHHQAFWLLALINGLCLIYQASQIIAYTRLRTPEVAIYHGTDDERTLSLLIANVLTDNRQAHLLLEQIHHYQPDIVLTLESDAWWQDHLDTLTAHDYHYTIKIPLDNLYGMHLYSRLELSDSEIRHWVADDIPSIKSKLKLRSNEWVYIYCLHPMPPSPTESATATDRDAELLLVGREIEFMDEPVLVFGDLNDVAWSSTSQLFQKISGLLDPRKGRGLFNTFHANYPLFRWPLDHIFHSHDFMVKDIQVLPNIGSDHFPVYGKFQYHPIATLIQDEPEADSDDIDEALDKIAKSEPNQEVVREKY
ncbi:endonuclease/exonuclease/phosphatase family protein [Moraxella equi]|nr:endonuclease/exonuclease/phosphatase family protein [Moraxella equi]OPH33665.1 endonuclease [Moraxella equi]